MWNDYLIVHYRKWFYHFLQRYTNNANITTNRQLNYKIYFMGWFQPWIHDFDSVKFKWRIGKTKMQMQSVICIINWKALFCLIMDWLKVCIVFAQIRQKQKWKPYAELYIATVTWMQILGMHLWMHPLFKLPNRKFCVQRSFNMSGNTLRDA